MSKPLLLDGFCKAGGAGTGYHRAGFKVVGVDIEPQKNYPFEFVQADFFEFVAEHGREFDVIHASPHCQGYSTLNAIWKREYPKLLPDTRAAVAATGKPYVIENVAGARKHMLHPVMLCGTMFGLRVYRHRLFESNVFLWQPAHPRHVQRTSNKVQRSIDYFVDATGHFTGVDGARAAMGIDWMIRDELSQAIPPAYTEHIGTQLMWHLEGAA